VAEEILERFPHGVWFIELGELSDPELVSHKIAAAFKLEESSHRSLVNQLKDYLYEKQLLIVLDNCEHVINDCASIAEALLRACPNLRILASSREAMRIAGEIIAHFYMAIIEFWSGDLSHACLLCEEAMEIARVIKNRWGLLEGHSLLGYIFRASGEVDRAVDHFQQALAIVQDTGEQGRIIRQLNFLGCAYGTQGDWPEAKR
jgi:tetratricopeptide (TPR) repeat protein